MVQFCVAANRQLIEIVAIIDAVRLGTLDADRRYNT